MDSESPSLERGSTHARWVTPLWVLMGIWTAWVAYEALDELNSQETVTGLIRDYRPPIEGKDGWVIDPSNRLLHSEVLRRFAAEKKESRPADDSIESWTRWLEDIGLEPRLATDDVPTKVHLRFPKDGGAPELWIGLFGVDHILYRSQIGVVQLKNIVTVSTTIELRGAELRPW